MRGSLAWTADRSETRSSRGAMSRIRRSARVQLRAGAVSTSTSATAGGRGRGGRGAAGPRGRRRMFGSGELRLVLLKLIADEPRHGYDLIRAIEELTGGDYAPSPGVVYPTLTMLTDMGLIEEAAAEGSRKAFAVTEEGKAHLEENADEVEALFERLEEAAPEQGRQAPSADRARDRQSDDRACATASRTTGSTRHWSTRSPRSSTRRRSGSSG